MKKMLLFVALFVLTLIQNASAQLTVLSPNGGETFVQGDTTTITWRCLDTTSQVNIYYRAYDQWGNLWNNLIALNVNAAAGEYKWPVSYSLSGFGQIYITSSANAAIGDVSDGAQYIQKAPVVQLVSPNGGQTLAEGSTYPITWKCNPTQVSKVNLLLLHPVYANQHSLIAQNIDAATGTYTWTVPYVWLPDSGRVVIEKVGYNGERDSSDANVYIKRTPYLYLETYFIGQTFVADDWITIKWQAHHIDSVKVEVTLDGTNWKTVGHYRYTSSTAQVRSTLIGTMGKVRVTALSNPELTDVTEGTFTQVPRTLKLLTPAGGEVLAGGMYAPLQLETNQPSPSTYFSFSYSTDGGSTWKPTSYTKSGSAYSWLVPKERSSNCRLKIESPNSDGTSLVSVSQPFTIKTPVKLLSPNGGETFVTTGAIGVRWDAHRDENILIEITYDGGASWQTIGTYAGYSSLFMTASRTGTQLKIRASSVSDPTNRDESDGFFTIVPHYIRVLSPTTNETLSPGAVYTINWETNSGTAHKLSYSTDGGASWKVINAGPYIGTSYQWTVPADYSSNCLIKVGGYYNTSEGISQPFRILPAYFQVTSPTGSSIWQEKKTVTVAWTDNVAGASYHVDFRSETYAPWKRYRTSIPGNSTGFYSTTITLPDFLCEYWSNTAQVMVSRVVNGTVLATRLSSYVTVGDGPDLDCGAKYRTGTLSQPLPEAAPDTNTSAVVEKLVLYPNPASHNLVVQAGGLAKEKTALLRIYSTTGTLVLQKQVPVVNGTAQTQLDIAALAPGTYLLKLDAGGQTQSTSFIKQ